MPIRAARPGVAIAALLAAAPLARGADTLDALFGRFVKATDATADALKPIKAKGDAAGHGDAVAGRLKAIATDVDALTAALPAAPAFDARAFQQVVARHATATRAAHERLAAALARLKAAGDVDVASELAEQLLKTTSALENFPTTAERMSVRPAGAAAAVAPPPVLNPDAGPTTPPFQQPLEKMFPADQIVTVHVLGLADRSPGRLAPIMGRVTGLAGGAYHSDHLGPGNDAYDVTVAPVTLTAATLAERIDFGTATADPGGRSVTVHVEAAKLDALLHGRLAMKSHPAPRPVQDRYPADQIVTVHLRGLVDRTGQDAGLMERLLTKLNAKVVSGSYDPDDASAEDLYLAAFPDLTVVAKGIDFGRVSAVDPSTRTITVEVDPAKVGPNGRGPAKAGAKPPPPLTEVPTVGLRVSVKRDGRWTNVYVQAREGRRFQVHVANTPESGDVWVAKEDLRQAGTE